MFFFLNVRLLHMRLPRGTDIFTDYLHVYGKLSTHDFYHRETVNRVSRSKQRGIPIKLSGFFPLRGLAEQMSGLSHEK